MVLRQFSESKKADIRHFIELLKDEDTIVPLTAQNEPHGCKE
jgi:hypothetical protein